MSTEIASWLGLPPARRLNLPPGYYVTRRVSAFERNPKCRAGGPGRPNDYCDWEGRERNLTDENMEKARQDCWRHYRRTNRR